MRLVLTRGAQDDLLAIGRFIARDDPAAARKFVSRLKARARLAARNPKAGRRVPEILREDVREVLVGTYRIIYTLRPRALVVLAFIEGHRELDPDQTLGRR